MGRERDRQRGGGGARVLSLSKETKVTLNISWDYYGVNPYISQLNKYTRHEDIWDYCPYKSRKIRQTKD